MTGEMARRSTPSSDDGTGKFGYMFIAADGDEFLFVRNLGEGMQGMVQLLQNVRTKELVARKVNHRRLNAAQVARPNRETTVIGHLDTLPRPAGCTPRYYELISHQDVPSGTAMNPARWTRESYWRYYNAGSLWDFQSLYSSKNPPPYAFIARCIHQLLETVQFMFTAGHVPVYHEDLHVHNIFVHWDEGYLPDFFIGDFGLARLADEPFPNAHVHCAQPGRTPPPNAPHPGDRSCWGVSRIIGVINMVLSFIIP